MTHENFTIGRLAKTMAVNVETIRYYQRSGLLTEPVRPHKGIRRYTERNAQRVRFIKQGQKLGFLCLAHFSRSQHQADNYPIVN